MNYHENYNILIPTVTYISKTYSVVRKLVKNELYTGDVTGIAQWFYQNIDINANNILITIFGNFHSTYPNPEHLTVEITYSGYASGKIHMSIDQGGNWYKQTFQQLNYYGGNKIKHTTKKEKKRKMKIRKFKKNNKKTIKKQ